MVEQISTMQTSTSTPPSQEELRRELETKERELADLKEKANPKPSVSITFEPNDTRFIMNMTVNKETQEPLITESQLLIAGSELMTMAEKMRSTRIDAGMKMEVRPQ